MFKKTITTLMVIALIAICICPVALAGSPELRFTRIYRADQYFDISSSGTAMIQTSMEAIYGKATSVQINSSLQHYSSGGWNTIKTWNNRNQGLSLSCYDTWPVASGYSYRVITDYYAIGSSGTESTTKISQTITHY